MALTYDCTPYAYAWELGLNSKEVAHQLKQDVSTDGVSGADYNFFARFFLNSDRTDLNWAIQISEIRTKDKLAGYLDKLHAICFALKTADAQAKANLERKLLATRNQKGLPVFTHQIRVCQSELAINCVGQMRWRERTVAGLWRMLQMYLQEMLPKKSAAQLALWLRQDTNFAYDSDKTLHQNMKDYGQASLSPAARRIIARSFFIATSDSLDSVDIHAALMNDRGDIDAALTKRLKNIRQMTFEKLIADCNDKREVAAFYAAMRGIEGYEPQEDDERHNGYLLGELRYLG